MAVLGGKRKEHMEVLVPSNRSTDLRRLIVFGRYPLPGVTKTRLIPVLGPMAAAELQRLLTEHSLDTALAAAVAPVEFCYCGADRFRVRRWLSRVPVDLSAQAPGDLGRRMHYSISSALQQGCRQVVLVGTDIPGMQRRHLQAAFNALNQHDVVLGPSRDGGYWLVGMRRGVDIFQSIDWGSPRVLAQTLAVVQKNGLSVVQLDRLNDIDTPDDLAGLQPEFKHLAPYLSVVIPTLNEAAHIRAAIDQVRHADTEVIVADGGSCDGTQELAAHSGAVVLHAPCGRALQQNMGARLACGRALLFLHADTRLPSDFRGQIFDLLMDSRVVLGAFQFKTDYHTRSMRLVEKAVRIRSNLFKMPYGDQALFMPRSVFERSGGFDPVPIAEDLYLVRRLAKLGRVEIAPGAALTSGRRWQAAGVLRTTVINYIIAIGCLAGFNPAKLAPLYARGLKARTKDKKNGN
jgi:uncharacterized protein